jgi:methionyl-tRNA formyltransferase
MANVLLIGIGVTTLSALESLLPICNVQGIVRNIDTEANSDSSVIDLAQKAGIPIFSDISPKAIKSLVFKFQPDCVVVSSYNRILQPELIELSTFVNVHYSPLPYYRGRANVNWAIINDEPYAAITIHKITSDLDGGNILFQQAIPIQFDDTVTDVYDKLNAIQQQNLGKIVLQVVNGYQGRLQNHAEATYCCARTPEDGEINWSDSTRKIDCFIRALVSPFPGAYTYFEGRKLTIWQAKPAIYPSYVGRIPGRVINRSKQEGYVDVLTGDGVLRILEVQCEGKEKISAASVIQSVKSTLGLTKSDLWKRIQTLEQEIIRLKENVK